ncbi:Ig-like domain-containing protein [Marinilongibacter aquaticus]|uniref:Ig-like domain-containing protein n=1 Tax=Marinilongibacter aquaticus TaxID=2975157 RepID=UPI0021BDCD36|nr:Ig-like domain-containing domain [Marinilongibacter aquaticus]
MINSYPENKTKHFKGQRISLEFDELIDANSLRQELIITPSIEGAYDLKAKPFSIELKFDKPFADSTTYTFNFREGVKDLNERNPAENLKLVFSTGDQIDSLQINGHVDNLWSGENAEDCTLALYDLSSKDTLPLLQRKPKYFVQTDSSGNFSLENLKASEYSLVAFTDKNNNLRFDEKNELFGFDLDTIRLTQNIDGKNLTVYPYQTESPRIQRVLSRQTNFVVRFDRGIQSAKIEFPNEGDSLTYKINNNELTFFNHPNPIDTTLTKLIVEDSLALKFETEQKVYFTSYNQKAPEPGTFRISFKDLKPNSTIKKPKYYDLDFPEPVTSVDYEKIHILSDTSIVESFTPVWLDSSHTQLRLEVQPKATETISLEIESSAITTYKSDTNSTYQLINKVYPQSEFGSISGRFDEFQGQKIAQLINAKGDQIIEQQIFTDEYRFPELLPSTYRIRIIEDKNENGKWDTADFYQQKLPERIFVSKGSIKVKANFILEDLQLK